MYVPSRPVLANSRTALSRGCPGAGLPVLAGSSVGLSAAAAAAAATARSEANRAAGADRRRSPDRYQDTHQHPELEVRVRSP
jgi:hypothetical protein